MKNWCMFFDYIKPKSHYYCEIHLKWTNLWQEQLCTDMKVFILLRVMTCKERNRHSVETIFMRSQQTFCLAKKSRIVREVGFSPISSRRPHLCFEE